MINYGDIETFIAKELQTFLGNNVKVVALPENQESYKPSVDKPHITVAFVKSDFEKQIGIDSETQEETMFFAIEIQSRTLRGVHGVQTLRQLIAGFLIGYKVPNTIRTYLHKSSWTEKPYENGTWAINLIICIDAYAIQQIEEEVLGILHQITIQNYLCDGVTQIRVMPDLNIPEL